VSPKAGSKAKKTFYDPHDELAFLSATRACEVRIGEFLQAFSSRVMAGLKKVD
jgi:hypothetical protein